MRKIVVCFLLLLSASTPGLSSAKSKVTAKCFPADEVTIWEDNYCLAKSKAADVKAESFKACFEEMKGDKSIPKNKCKRIKWLKDKACEDDRMNGHTREECLSDKKYLENSKSDTRP